MSEPATPTTPVTPPVNLPVPAKHKPSFTFKPSRKEILALITERVNDQIASMREQYTAELNKLQAEIKERIRRDTAAALKDCKASSSALKAIQKVADDFEGSSFSTTFHKKHERQAGGTYKQVPYLQVTLVCNLPVPSDVQLHLDMTTQETERVNRLNTIIYGGRRGKGTIEPDEIASYIAQSDPAIREQIEQTASLITGGIMTAAEDLLSSGNS